MDLKTCNKCGQAKLLDEFYRNKRNADNRLNTCKVCFRAARKPQRRELPDETTRAQWKAEQDERRKADRIARGINIDGIQMCRVCHRFRPLLEYNLVSRKYLNASCRECTRIQDQIYLNRPGVREARKQRMRDRRESGNYEGVERFYAYSALRRRYGLSVKGAPEVTLYSLAALYNSWCCAYCGIATNPRAQRRDNNKSTVDHVVPASVEDCTHLLTNTLLICHPCNVSKYNMPLEEFLGKDNAEEIRELMASRQHLHSWARKFALPPS